MFHLMAEFDFDPHEAPVWPSRSEPASVPEAERPAAGGDDQPTGWGRPELVLGAIAMVASAALTLSLLVARSEAPALAVQAAAEAPAPAAPSAPATTSAATWESKSSWLGSQKGIAYEVAAESAVDVWMRRVHPALIVRCNGQQAEVFVFTGTAAAIESNTEDHSVTLRVDDEPFESSLWPDSAEHDALFAPDGAAMARRLMHARTFAFTFTPHNTATVTVRFNTAGLGDLLQPSAKHCGW